MARLTFSGHDSFSCKQFWLKKGFDFVSSDDDFSDDNAVVRLGVGKNMVRSIRFWLYAFGVTKDDKTTASELGEYLFGEAGKDIYLEDIASIWLLHHHLVSLENASIYSLVFNEFRAGKSSFSKEQIHNFLKVCCSENSSTVYNENTIDRDIKVFVANYIKPGRKKKARIEDSYSSLLHELNLLSVFSREVDVLTENGLITESKNYYSIKSEERKGLPFQIVLFSILSNEDFSNSISFKDLENAHNSPGRIFALTSNGLFDKIQEIITHYKGITFSETAGNRILQINSEINKWDILNDYYNKQ